jgi:hypothetical protein
MFDEISTEAFDVILAWQVTLIDPHWGREALLWDVLTERFLNHPASTHTHTEPHSAA